MVTTVFNVVRINQFKPKDSEKVLQLIAWKNWAI